ncbi:MULTISPECIES: GNAT family N-acetyltransferase [Actinosynnema]|uniref:GNAT family N-acetyltransferase n=1 Tax=Actinosynnema pretiosum TaxID=42197 RepID=A0A290Z130_9PSEU|nr:GNAT family N-acetyltransferase [Actinosynnema pretiosum]ATE52669.1 GNAT family N-acetyltransferase [Actinosynnema pretiosum]
MVDPLHDPDDPELLDPYRARDLAGLVENARLASGAVRYGRIGAVGCARVVVNPDSPLPGGNHACALDGTSAEVAGTLLRLERSFADVGRAEAVVYASPTTVAEIEGIADDAGWYAVEELLTFVHRRRRGPLAESAQVRPAADADLPQLAELLADDLGVGGSRKLVRHLGQRLDDPRCAILVVDDGDRVGGFASGFGEHRVGLVEQVVVRPARRRRGIGSALVGGLVSTLWDAGALLVSAQVAEGGAGERFAEACGFEAAYPVTAYARRVDELLD